MRSAVELTNFQFPDFPFSIENNWLEQHLELRSTKHRWLSDFPLFIENRWLESHLRHHPWRSDVPFSIEYRWLERHLTTVAYIFPTQQLPSRNHYFLHFTIRAFGELVPGANSMS